MTALQQILHVIGGNDTLKLANELLKSPNDVKIFEAFDITFRLIKTQFRNINLEILAQITIESGEELDVFGMSGRSEKRITFFKAISFYEQEGEILKLTVLKEFYDEYSSLSASTYLIPAQQLSLAENALIAAFSKEAYYAAIKEQDTSILINGLKVDFFMSFEGLPQSFLDDSYGLIGPIGVYEFCEDFTEARPMVQYKHFFDEFAQMGLLTMFNE